MTNRQDSSVDGDPVPFEQLSTSYRFDNELAAFLTEFQYRDDGITLTAAQQRPLPPTAHTAPTPGIDAVLGAGASLVLICYDGYGHRMVNPIETQIISALADTLSGNRQAANPQPDGGTAEPLGEEPSPDTARAAETNASVDEESSIATTSDVPAHSVSMGVVTPHNAQRGSLETVLPDGVMARTVEKYQGGERDIIAVSATVADPEFARKEERFILNPRRLNVAISRSRLLTIVICSTGLFEIAPADSDRLDDGPVWARLFTQAVGEDPDPSWAGPLAEFTPSPVPDYGEVPVRVYPSSPP